MITNLNIGKYGRLGNQIYQYVSLVSLSKKLDTEVWIPEESENYNSVGRFNPVINTYDTYNNDLFRLFDLKIGIKKPIKEIIKNINHYYDEPNIIQYHNSFEKIIDNTSIHGYFQSKNYFLKFESVIKNELKLNDEYFNYASNLIFEYKKNFDKIISVHIRRGDGLQDNFSFAAELSYEKYYEKLIMENKKNNDLVLFFSDDIEWCKNKFIGNNYLFIDNREKKFSHLYDFSLISMCDINISSVSTFSWWSCWLNPLENEKKIFIPETWWGSMLKHNDNSVYYYDNWIKVKNL